MAEKERPEELEKNVEREKKNSLLKPRTKQSRDSCSYGVLRFFFFFSFLIFPSFIKIFYLNFIFGLYRRKALVFCPFYRYFPGLAAFTRPSTNKI